MKVVSKGGLLTVFFVVTSLLMIAAVGNAEESIPQLTREVMKLKAVNELNLSKGQIELILPILKEMKIKRDLVKQRIIEDLAKEKDALLKGKQGKFDERYIAVLRFKVRTEMEKSLGRLKSILTREQNEKLIKMMRLSLESKVQGRGVGPKNRAFKPGENIRPREGIRLERRLPSVPMGLRSRSRAGIGLETLISVLEQKLKAM